MSQHPLQLKPAVPVARDATFGVQMRRAKPVPAPVVRVAAPSRFGIGAGADMFADATEIPYRECRDVLAGYTYNKLFSAEADEPETVAGTPPQKTAWWRVRVPADKTAWLTVDTQLSFGASGNPDTQLAVWWIAEPFSGLGDLAPIKRNEDVGSDIDGRGTGYHSRLENIELAGDRGSDDVRLFTDYFVQVGDYADGVPGICYVLRVSLTEIEPGSTPADGTDPDA